MEQWDHMYPEWERQMNAELPAITARHARAQDALQEAREFGYEVAKGLIGKKVYTNKDLPPQNKTCRRIQWAIKQLVRAAEDVSRDENTLARRRGNELVREPLDRVYERHTGKAQRTGRDRTHDDTWGAAFVRAGAPDGEEEGGGATTDTLGQSDGQEAVGLRRTCHQYRRGLQALERAIARELS